jgi:chromosome segregation ATPase
MSSEALVIAALGLTGALLSIVGLRLATQFRKMRSRLLAELEVRDKLTGQLNELPTARARASEAREAAEALRRDLAQSKAEAASLKDHIERLKMDLLRATATASDAVTKCSEVEARNAALISAAEKAESRLHDHSDLIARIRNDAGAAAERATRLEKQLQEAQKRLSAAQTETAKLSKAASRADADAKAAETASEELRSLKLEIERARAKLGEAEHKARKLHEAAASEASTLQEELDRTKAELAQEAQKREEAERRASSVSTNTAPMDAPKLGASAVVAALDADPSLNRGQRETIRMMYDKFTAKSGKA